MTHSEHISSNFLKFKQYAREPFFQGLASLSLCVAAPLVSVFFKKTVKLLFNKVSPTLYIVNINSLKTRTGIAIFMSVLWLYMHRRLIQGGRLPYALTRNADLSNKVIFITHGHLGFGYETAKQCLLWGATVWMGCRNPQAAYNNIERLKTETQNTNVRVFELDLEDLASCQRCANEIKASNIRVDMLLLLAADPFAPYFKSKQGHEMQFAIHHLGHFCLTVNLLTQLENWNSRIICLSSFFHTTVAMKYSAHPGFVQPFDDDASVTAVGSHESCLDFVFSILRRLLCKIPKNAINTVTYLMLENKDKLESGGYYCDCKCVEPMREATNPIFAKKLWDESLNMSSDYITRY